MYKSINFSQFTDEFRRLERENSFSYEGLEALFEYIEDLEESTGEPWELDVIALCSEFTEYTDLAELQKSYPHIEDMDHLENETIIIKTSLTNFIIQDF